MFNVDRPGRRGGLIDELWRASLTIVLVSFALSIAWSLLQRFIGPLAILVLLLGIIRIAVGFARRRRDGW